MTPICRQGRAKTWSGDTVSKKIDTISRPSTTPAITPMTIPVRAMRLDSSRKLTATMRDW